jgi:hypothetical protein
LNISNPTAAVTIPVNTMTARQSANPVECFMRSPPMPVVMCCRTSCRDYYASPPGQSQNHLAPIGQVMGISARPLTWRMSSSRSQSALALNIRGVAPIDVPLAMEAHGKHRRY